MSGQVSRLEKVLYILLALTSSFIAILGYLYVAAGFGILSADGAGALIMVYSFTLLPVGLLVSCAALVATVLGLVRGPSLVRRRVLVWYMCLVAIVLPVDRVSNFTAASIAAVGLGVLVSLPITWYLGGIRTAWKEFGVRQGEPGIGRSIFAIIAGYLVIAVGDIALWFAEGAQTTGLVLTVGSVFVIAALGGYVAGLVAKRAALWHALGVFGLSVAMGIVPLIGAAVGEMLWFVIAHLVPRVSGLVVGGYLRERQVRSGQGISTVSS